MSLKKINIHEDDFDLFVLLENPDKIEFLFDAISMGARGAMLKQVAKFEVEHSDDFRLAHVEDVLVGRHRLCIVKYEDTVTFNCDSLAIINRCVNKILSEGNILIRNRNIKKTNIDVYKYFKAYEVIKLSMPISDN
jgi:hypothetical protein